MGKEQGEKYYDEIWPGIIQNIDKTREQGNEPPWDKLWTAIANYIYDGSFKVVYDIGCGPGHLAQKLHEKLGRGMLMEKYIGMDFSHVAIEHARNLRLPGFVFLWGDAVRDEWLGAGDNPESTVYVFCEILEHVEDDFALLNKVPVGAHVILTVPNFDDPGHVRYFKGMAEVEGRYGAFFTRFGNRDFPPGHFMMSGVRSDYSMKTDATPSRPKELNTDGITLYMIVKDEEMGIRRAIESCGDLLADAVVLVDTATTDDTRNIARNCGARTYTYNWTKNFAAARNAAMEDVKTKWGLVLDGHEFLQGDLNKIRRAILEHPDAGAFEIEVKDSGVPHWDSHRLHKVAGARWERAHHNYLTVDGPVFRIEGVRIIHDREGGQSMESRLARSKQRDEELIEDFTKSIKENPKDTRSMYYLAQQHRDSGRWEAAYYWYNRYTETESPNRWQEEHYLAHYFAGRAAMALGDYERALQHGKDATHLIEDRAEGWALRGDAHYAQKEYVRALRAYETAVKSDVPKNAKLPVDLTLHKWGWRILDQLSMAQWHLAQYERGRDTCRLLLQRKELPGRERARVENNLKWHEKKLTEMMEHLPDTRPSEESCGDKLE